MNNNITYFAKTNSRGREVEFGIKDDDRLRHLYVIGKTGMGKSTMFENMAAQDIKKGNGLCFIDPHGSAIDTLLEYIPKDRIEDVIYFAPFDVENPIAFNVMDNTGLDGNSRFLVAQGLLAAFKKIFGEESFSDRMIHITNNTLLALLEYPGSTLLSITRMLTDDGYREEVVSVITDPSVKAFWVNEYGKWEDRFRKEASAAILNKLGQFNSNPLIRNIVGQEGNSMDFRKIMDEKKILMINLSKGQVGEDNANLLGAMITTKIYLAAMSRADMSRAELALAPNFYLYIDEFQNVANDSFANILAEARKYKLSLLMAHQYIEQMPDTVRAAIFGNVGTTITFRVGPEDSEILEKLFSPTFYADDIVNLRFTEIYLSLMIDGVGSTPFSANTLPPIAKAEITFLDEVIDSSRKQYARTKKDVEDKVNTWLEKEYKTNKMKKEDEKRKEYLRRKEEAEKTGVPTHMIPKANARPGTPQQSGGGYSPSGGQRQTAGGTTFKKTNTFPKRDSKTSLYQRKSFGNNDQKSQTYQPQVSRASEIEKTKNLPQDQQSRIVPKSLSSAIKSLNTPNLTDKKIKSKKPQKITDKVDEKKVIEKKEKKNISGKSNFADALKDLKI